HEQSGLHRRRARPPAVPDDGGPRHRSVQRRRQRRRRRRRRRGVGCGLDGLGSCGGGGMGGGSGLLQKDVDLNSNERRYLLSVEMGDMTSVRQYVENAETLSVNVNCVDSLGRSAVLIAIEFEHIELLEMLLSFGFLELGDALLHAIQEENVVAVEMLLHAQAEKQQKKPQAPGPMGAVPSSSFTPDITPIILAAHIDNYEILKILLDRGDRVPKPHELRCACDECVLAQKEDSLRHSKSRINAYKALASPSLICLSSKDPILTAFELSWEMKRLGRLENEFKSEYEQLAAKCQEYASALLEQTRSSAELAIVLNQDIGQSGHKVNEKALEETDEERMTLSRLKLAIKYKQKKFVAHPHCQQLLAALWYDGLPGFRRKHLILQMGMIATFAGIFPALAFMYLLAPHSEMGQKMRKPFIKFICHSASYLLFLGFLVLAAIRVEDLLFDTMELKMKERGAGPSAVELIIVTYVMGFVWQEIKQLWNEGAKAYVTDMWNLLDFATNALYIATINAEGRRLVPVLGRVRPTLISECLFATANIFSMLKLVYIFTVNPHLGPLQISFRPDAVGHTQILFVVVLVLSSFACGFNQLYYWFLCVRRGNKYLKM
uniref:ANK_REP_REGION domain-containing protein n=1 Tax=Macrostomum lignano TaxID=282301 RepID=A0A1I8II44_9PLAT